MANKIILKKSSVASKIPLTSDLDLGELALNTYDGKLFTKKSVNSVESIVEIGEVKEARSNTFTANQVISVTDNTNAALRVTQLGTGNAILVEDNTNPDATPFAVAADGSVIIGNTTAQSGGGVFQIGGGQTTNAANYATQYSYANASRYTLARANAGVTSVSSGDRVGDFVFSGHDGTSFVRLAHIAGDVDGTPGTNDMPGRLVFATTSDGTSSPAERMRISSDGDVLVTSGSLSIGNTDTTITRSAAGVIAVEGVTVPLNSTTNTHTAQQYEIGNASDTTLTRVSAGVAAIEGKNIALNGTSEVLTTGSIELGNASDTTITRSAAGVIAVEGGIVPKENRTNTFTANQIIEITDNTNAALRITQLGTGDAIRVEDSANPDTTPFVVTAAGDAGIGATPTNGKLHVEGRVYAATGYSLPNDQPIFWGPGDGTTNIYGNSTSDYLYVSTAGSERFRIDANGNVGIGTNAPISKIHSVIPSSGSALLLNMTGGGAGNYVDLDFVTYNTTAVGYANPSATIRAIDDGTYSSHLVFRTKGNTIGASQTEHMRLTSSGNLGIGTPTPSTKLLVSGASETTAAPTDAGTKASTILVMGGSEGPGSGGTVAFGAYGDTFAAIKGYIRNASTNGVGDLIFSTRNDIGDNSLTARMNICYNGNIGIGTDTEIPSYKLQVNGSFAATTKSFVIDHPTKPNMKLRYGSLESPYHGVRLTGESIIATDKVVVDLPDYIHGLCKQEGAQVQITNIKHDKVIWIDEIDIKNNKFIVCINRKKSDKKEYRFYWSFTGIRKDIEDMIVEF